MKRKPASCLAVVLIAAAHAFGDEPKVETVQGLPESPQNCFTRGEWEATLATGVLFSPILADNGRAKINYTLTELQVGWMWTDVKDHGWVRGNWEIAGEGFGGGIFEGPGNYVAGLTVWLRYNFVPRNWRVVPYLQGGAGLMLTDTDRKLIGQAFNFNIDTGLGVRCFLARNWSMNVEYRYQHISNARTSSNDIGINAHGAMVGVSYFF